MDKRGATKQGLIVLAVIFGALALYAAVRTLTENDEGRVRKVIYAATLGVENEDIARCSSFFSDSYLDTQGYDKVAVLKILSDIFKSFRDLKVEIKQLKVEIKELEAEANIGFKCYMKKAAGEQVYYDAGKLKVIFKKEDDRWKARSVEYTGSDQMLFLNAIA
jgi:hypothetical protein